VVGYGTKAGLPKVLTRGRNSPNRKKDLRRERRQSTAPTDLSSLKGGGSKLKCGSRPSADGPMGGGEFTGGPDKHLTKKKQRTVISRGENDRKEKERRGLAHGGPVLGVCFTYLRGGSMIKAWSGLGRSKKMDEIKGPHGGSGTGGQNG